MGAKNHVYVVFVFDKVVELINIWARWKTDQHTCGQMYRGNTVLIHLFNTIFNISTWASSASGISDELNFHVFVQTESAFPILQGSQAFATSTRVVAFTDYYCHVLFSLRHEYHAYSESEHYLSLLRQTVWQRLVVLKTRMRQIAMN